MDKIQELIKKAENKVNSTMLSNIRKNQINLILLEIQNEAINYTRCCTELPKTNCTLNRQTCGKGSGCKYPHCYI